MVVGALVFLSANGMHINIGHQELCAVSRGLSTLYYFSCGYSSHNVTFVIHYYTLFRNGKQKRDIKYPAWDGRIRPEKLENSAKSATVGMSALWEDTFTEQLQGNRALKTSSQNTSRSKL